MSDDEDRFLVAGRLPLVLEGRVLSSWIDRHCCGEDYHRVDARHCTTCGEVTCWRSGMSPGGTWPPRCSMCDGDRTRTEISEDARQMPRAELLEVLRPQGVSP